MSRKRTKVTLTFLMGLTCLFLNPFALQGCYLKCPEPTFEPYIVDYSSLEKDVQTSISRTFVAQGEDGVVEITFSNTSIVPQYREGSEPNTTWTQLNLITPAFATAACQTSRRGTAPIVEGYEVSSQLTAIWIPAEGDAITLTQNLPVQGIASGDLYRIDYHSLTLSGQSSAFGKPEENAQWNATFSSSRSLSTLFVTTPDNTTLLSVNSVGETHTLRDIELN